MIFHNFSSTQGSNVDKIKLKELYQGRIQDF